MPCTLSKVPQGRHKPYPNLPHSRDRVVSSLRDLSDGLFCVFRKLKPTVNKISSLRDYGRLRSMNYNYLFEMRWDGFICSKCDMTTKCWFTARNTFRCNNCEHQASLVAGTIFQDTKKPLLLWFHIMVGSAKSRSKIVLQTDTTGGRNRTHAVQRHHRKKRESCW